MMRSFFILLAMAAAAPVRADSEGVEHARYSVASSAGEFEIRDYAPQIVAETSVSGSREAAAREGFRRIARYIFGANRPSRKIEMTAPVEQQKGETIAMTAPVIEERAGGSWTVRFVMPASYTLATLPQPDDSSVRLATVPGRRMAAVRFSGLVDDADLETQKARLLDFVAKQGLAARGEPTYAFYDPPWTLPFDRRNEVLVEIGRK
jgi:effector-binding domain-containing protein